MFKKYLPFVFAPFLLSCTPSEDEINYHLNSPVAVEVYTEGVYATIDLKGVEQVGTMAAAYLNLSYASAGDTLHLNRNLKSINRGDTLKILSLRSFNGVFRKFR